MIRASDFDWIIIDQDGMESMLDPADIYSFEFKWGGYQNRQRAPEQFSGSGVLLLNHRPAITVLDRYRELRIEAASQTYFSVIVEDYRSETGVDLTRLELQSRGAFEAEKEIEWGLRPTFESPAVEVHDFAIPGVTLMQEPMAPLSPISCVTPPSPDGDFFKTTIRRVITGVESLGHLILLEDVSLPSPSWRVLPMPLNSDSDHRHIGKMFSGFNDLINVDKYRQGLARHWAADAYEASIGGTPFESRMITLTNTSISARYDRDFGYYLGQNWDRTKRANVWTGENITNFAGFYRFQVDRLDGTPTTESTYISPDGSYIGIVIDTDATDVDVFGRLHYYVWDDSWNTTQRTFYANGQNLSEKRTIGNTLIAIYSENENPSKLQALIDEWDDWYPVYAKMEFIVEDLTVGSPARHKPGDRIGLNVSELSHHAVIIGAQWRVRGNRPLRVTWDIVTQEDIPNPRVYLGDLTHPVSVGAESNEAYIEA